MDSMPKRYLDLVAKVDPKIQLDPKDHTPICTPECRHHDGKRCRLTGNEPEQLCEPAVALVILAFSEKD